MKLHFIAIGGTGMGSLAGLLKKAGHDVRGSDVGVYPPMSEQLEQLDVHVFDGFAAENLDWSPDKVVVGNVCTKDHVEVVAAQELGLPLVSFPALLSEMFLQDKHSLVVAGTHGKTTTSALLAHVLTDAGLDPSFLIGGVPKNFGSGFGLGSGEHFVVEGDEYDSAFFDKVPKFLHYQPTSAILTSVELDHVDIYDSFEDVKASFEKFVSLMPEDGLLCVAASSPEAVRIALEAEVSQGCRVELYAAGSRAVEGCRPLWHADIGEPVDRRRSSFTVTRDGEFFGTFDFALTGEHNVENALAVIAVGASLDLSTAQLARGLQRFKGVARRQEFRGFASGVTLIDDYAHHPTALRETIKGIRGSYPNGKLVAVYEPRSATSRRSIFQKEYAAAFEKADEVVVAPLYKPDSIPEDQRFSRETLIAELRRRGTKAFAVDSVEEVASHVIDTVKPGDTVAVFSCGDFAGVHDLIFQRLGDAITPATADDMDQIARTLEATGLGREDRSELKPTDFLIVSDESGQVGCVALQQYDDSAILRSLAVVKDRRGRGLGWMLADSVLAGARAAGVKRLYLLTESASDFFATKLGFRAIDRRILESDIASSKHFREAVATATVMRLDL